MKNDQDDGITTFVMRLENERWQTLVRCKLRQGYVVGVTEERHCCAVPFTFMVYSDDYEEMDWSHYYVCEYDGSLYDFFCIRGPGLFSHDLIDVEPGFVELIGSEIVRWVQVHPEQAETMDFDWSDSWRLTYKYQIAAPMPAAESSRKYAYKFDDDYFDEVNHVQPNP